MSYEVQETNLAYGPTDTIPEDAWRFCTRHRKLAQAGSSRARLRASMRKRCGPGAQDSHRRVVDSEGQDVTAEAIEAAQQAEWARS